MARIIYSISNLARPLSRLQELYTVIPQGRTLSILGLPRIAYFLGDSVELLRSDGTSAAIGEGDVLVAPGGVHYKIRALDRNQKARNHALVVTLDEASLTAPVEGDRNSASLAADLKEIFSHGLRLVPDGLNQGSARSILQLIRREADKKSDANPLLISGLCTALVAGLLRGEKESPTSAAAPPAKGQAAVEHARQYMRQFCHEKLTLSQIAWEIQLSGEHLARLFRLHTGSSVFEYLDEIRIEKARQLLQTTDLPVVRIAPICGFPTSALLARHFKARTGRTPLAYRLDARGHESFRPSAIDSPPATSGPNSTSPRRRKH